MRRQLRAVVDEHARSAPITHDALRTLGEFKYDEVAEELVIEDVYVRLFCEVCFEALLPIFCTFIGATVLAKTGFFGPKPTKFPTSYSQVNNSTHNVVDSKQ